MDKLRKEALQVTKELVVKFIEAGRVSPGNLGEVFSQTYAVVLRTIALENPEDCGKSAGQDMPDRPDKPGKSESRKSRDKD